MIKILFNFFALATAIGFGIKVFRDLTGKEKWDMTKLVAYSIFCGIVSAVVLTTIVILF